MKAFIAAVISRPRKVFITFVVTLAVRVNFFSNQFLTSTAFSRDENCCVGPGKLANQFKNLAHRLALPHEARNRRRVGSHVSARVEELHHLA